MSVVDPVFASPHRGPARRARRTLAALATSAAVAAGLLGAAAAAPASAAPLTNLHPASAPAYGLQAASTTQPRDPQTKGAPVLREDRGGQARPAWGMKPAPGQDCPAGSTRVGGSLLKTDFTGGAGAFGSSTMTIASEGGNSFARQTGGTGTLLKTQTLAPGANRLYVGFDVRGSFAAHDLAVTPNNDGGGWYIPAAPAGTSTTTWRHVAYDFTDGANEGTWNNDLTIEWVRNLGQGTLDIDNVDIYQCSPTLSREPGDFNGDGLADVAAIMSDGRLIMSGGTLTTPQTIWPAGVAWQDFNWIQSAGDVNGDGKPDLLGRTSNGDFYIYSGDGVRSFTGAKKVGWGWQWMTSIIPVGDVNGDGHPDLIARSDDGTMRMYSFNTDGSFFGGWVVGSGWENFKQVIGIRTSAVPGTPTRLYAIASNGDMKSYTVSSTGAMTGWGKKVGTEWYFNEVTSVGDFDGDGIDDVVGVSADGSAYVYPANGDGVWKARMALPSNIWSAALVIG